MKSRQVTIARLVPPMVMAMLTTPAAAQEPVTAAPLDGISQCRSITAEAARLACFDREVTALEEAVRREDVRLVSRHDVERTRRGLFGFSLPRIGLFGGGRDEDEDESDELAELETLTSTITEVRATGPDSWLFRIADGRALWQITNAPSRLRPPQAGQTVVFQRATLGSYFIRLNGQIGVKGKRVE
ncbi:MAG: hypothetical protein DI636_00945 [Pelagerythrobacter marensis]|nr:MAG: hypothetical protein DI636_00945 [Pelagerythrobacter marensis]